MDEQIKGRPPEPLETTASGDSGRQLPELVIRARGGDDGAFLALMTESRDTLLRISLAYLRSEDAALEAIQETTCRAYSKLAKLRKPAYFRTWLIRILLNVCADEQKRRRRQRPSAVLPERSTDAAELGEGAAWRFEEAIAPLAPKLRQVVILKYAEDMTTRDIAGLLGRPEGTIKTWLNKALVELRKRLGEEEREYGLGTLGYAAGRKSDRR